jgi:hypothetical protein
MLLLLLVYVVETNLVLAGDQCSSQRNTRQSPVDQHGYDLPGICICLTNTLPYFDALRTKRVKVSSEQNAQMRIFLDF